MVRIVFQYDMWHRRGGPNFLLHYQFSRKSVYNVGNNFVSVPELEILFPNINEGRNCNLYPHLCLETVFPALKLTQLTTLQNFPVAGLPAPKSTSYLQYEKNHTC